MTAHLRGRAPRPFRRALLAVCVGVVGCNAILDNKPGSLESPGAKQVTPITCGSEQVACDDACVDRDDPAHGCGSRTCLPCPADHGTATCLHGACAIEACEPGHADCNGRLEDGCEADLSSAESCGECGAACEPDRPLCAPAGDRFECAVSCPAEAPERCGDVCVSTQTSAEHCGSCDVRCPAIENGSPACNAGQCALTCQAGRRACADRCVLATDPTACGPTCAVCPAPPNATATCVADACGMACAAGFGDCNADPKDGCEAIFATDPKNCGGCGVSCDGGTCTGGRCEAKPDAAPPG